MALYFKLKYTTLCYNGVVGGKMLVDIAIILLLLTIVVRGRETGLVRQAGSAAGFVGGLFLGAALQPYAMQYADTTLSRALMALTITLACALVLANLGEFLGTLLKIRIQKFMPLNKADAIGGSLAGVASLLAAIWLITPLLISLPSAGLQTALRKSYIVNGLKTSLPSAPGLISGLDRLINPNGFPDVFSGLEHKPLDPDTPLPSLGDLQPAVQQTRASVVKLEGRGCGGIVEGSGFVAAKDTVVTNAHVVAGVRKPVVIDTKGEHEATAIWFDSSLDMAVLKINDSGSLAGQPLSLDTAVKTNGTPSVVVGYPGGGGFTASPATILDQFTATGRDIYGRGLTARSIYEIRATVIPGNSGGPLIDKDGKVIGLVFATSTTYNNVGYVLTLKPVADNLSKALQQDNPVATGSCAS
jgi:S1-C subfamily serine protease